jgi:hypothetical protein
MESKTDITNYLSLLCAINPNDSDLGKEIRKFYGSELEDMETPDRSCDIDDEECLSCGS